MNFKAIVRSPYPGCKVQYVWGFNWESKRIFIFFCGFRKYLYVIIQCTSRYLTPMARMPKSWKTQTYLRGIENEVAQLWNDFKYLDWKPNVLSVALYFNYKVLFWDYEYNMRIIVALNLNRNRRFFSCQEWHHLTNTIPVVKIF